MLESIAAFVRPIYRSLRYSLVNEFQPSARHSNMTLPHTTTASEIWLGLKHYFLAFPDVIDVSRVRDLVIS